jgi:S1-C subfamily serine protease
MPRISSPTPRRTAYIETRIRPCRDDQGASIGAGFVIDRKRRWLLTNAHVSGRSPAHITAKFYGAEPVRAWPVYIDPYLDLAILEYDPAGGKEGTETASLDCEMRPGTGHPVGAFGHPNGFKFSGTRGVISGQTNRFGADWLQTDAPINGGNSGGPLISLVTGRVVGINTATLDDNQSQNANFAALASQACRVIALLKQGADPRPASLGVSFFREVRRIRCGPGIRRRRRRRVCAGVMSSLGSPAREHGRRRRASSSTCCAVESHAVQLLIMRAAQQSPSRRTFLCAFRRSNAAGSFWVARCSRPAIRLISRDWCPYHP